MLIISSVIINNCKFEKQRFDRLNFFSGDLFATLDIHIASLPKVSIIRLKTSQGLMVARQTGIERAKSEYFIVMDSHMEVVTGKGPVAMQAVVATWKSRI